MAASAAVEPTKETHLPTRMASSAAMKNVLSPSSDRKMRLGRRSGGWAAVGVRAQGASGGGGGGGWAAGRFQQPAGPEPEGREEAALGQHAAGQVVLDGGQQRRG